MLLLETDMFPLWHCVEVGFRLAEEPDEILVGQMLLTSIRVHTGRRLSLTQLFE